MSCQCRFDWRASIRRLGLGLGLGAIVFTGAAHAQEPVQAAPTEPVQAAPVEPVQAVQLETTPTLAVTPWRVLGPWPCPTGKLSDAEETLNPLGGEAKAVLTSTATLTLAVDGATTTLQARAAQAGPGGVLDLAALYPGRDNHQACAFTWLDSPAEQDVWVFFQSDDGARLWIDGELMKAAKGPMLRDPQGLPHQMAFPLHLKAGRSRVLVTIAQETGPWGLKLELKTPAAAEQALAVAHRRQALREFQECEIGPQGWYVCAPGEFPELVWRNPRAVEAAYGQLALNVRWFDNQLNEVTEPEKPGRYAAYIEAATTGGLTLRRALTIYCAKPDEELWSNDFEVEVPALRSSQFGSDVWTEQSEAINSFASGKLQDDFYSTAQGAAIVAALAEQGKPLGHRATQLESPVTSNQDYQLRLKRKILGVDGGHYPALKQPGKKEGAPATELHPGTLADGGMKPEGPQTIRAACQKWCEAAGEPFSVCIARHGVIVFEEAFGTRGGQPVTPQTRYQLASITKSMTGLLFAQFMDQGLLHPDDPVGRYLPGFPTTGPQVLTLRHCLTHTSGFEGHGDFGGMDNPWLDNVLASGLPQLKHGQAFLYNGMGFDLAGKVMEVVSGKSIFRLFQESFYQPLGLSPELTQVDLAYGVNCRAVDLARVGQLMLNRGAYGPTRFISAETFEQILPRPLVEHFPQIADKKQEYGFGISWMRDETPEKSEILGHNTIGHGSATGCVLRVDYDHDLVVTLTRSTPGKEYGPNLTAFMKAVAASLE